jgi:hypothetical protein
MTFNYEFNEEAIERKLLEPGVYKFTVIKSTPKISPKGYKMFTLTLKIIADEEEYLVFAFLVFAQAGLCKKNISGFCKAVKIDDFEKNLYREDFSDLQGLTLIGVEKDRDLNDRNVVKEWIATDNASESKQEDLNDEIPF